MSVKSSKSEINCKLIHTSSENKQLYGVKYTSHHIIFTYCESVINKNTITASQNRLIYGLCRQCKNPLSSLTDTNDVCNGFIYLTSPSDIENISN